MRHDAMTINDCAPLSAYEGFGNCFAMAKPTSRKRQPQEELALSHEWIAAPDAARQLGIVRSSLREARIRHGWASQKIKHDGRQTVYLLVKDVKTYHRNLNLVEWAGPYGRKSERESTLVLVAWADALTKYPTDAEILEQVEQCRSDGAFSYRFKDIVSVVENRERRQRKSKFKWASIEEWLEKENHGKE